MTLRPFLLSCAAAVLLALAVVASPSGSAGTQPVDQPSGSGDVEAGEQVFQANCAMCHGSDASGMMGMHPSLRGAIDRLSRDGVEVTIREGRRTQPPMPAWEGRLTDDEIDDVIAYIASLPDGPRNFGPGDGDGMMMGDGDDAFGSVGLVVLVALVITGVGVAAWAVHRSAASPRRVLDRRYAAGEISREDYLQRRTDLKQNKTG